MTTIPCPWHLTQRAVERCQALLGNGVGYCQALRRLAEIVAETVASTRAPRALANGAVRYRGPRPERFTLIVVPAQEPGRLPSLVDVCPQSPDVPGPSNNRHQPSPGQYAVCAFRVKPPDRRSRVNGTSKPEAPEPESSRGGLFGYQLHSTSKGIKRDMAKITIALLNSQFGHGEDPKLIGGIPLVASPGDHMTCWKFGDEVATQTTTQINPPRTTWSRNVERWKLSPARASVPEYDDGAPSVSVQAPEPDDDGDDPGDPEDADDLAQAIAELAPREDILQILELLSDEDNGDDHALQTLRRVIEQRSRFEVSLRRYNEFQFHIRSCLNMPTNLITVAGTDEVIEGLLKRLASDREPKSSEADAEAKQSAELAAQATTEATTNASPVEASSPPDVKPSVRKAKT
jgi:hypothetical protein